MPEKEAPNPDHVDETAEVEENEVLRASRLAKALKEGAEQKKSAGIGWKTAAGIGVGSAAVLAALIYAKSGKK